MPETSPLSAGNSPQPPPPPLLAADRPQAAGGDPAAKPVAAQSAAPADRFERVGDPTVFELTAANQNQPRRFDPIPERQVSATTGYPQVRVPVPGYDHLAVTGGFMEPHGHSNKPVTHAIFSDNPGRVVDLPASDRNLGIDFVPQTATGGIDPNVRSWFNGTVTAVQRDPVFGGSGAEGYGRRVEIQTDRTLAVTGTDGVTRNLPVMVAYGHLASFSQGLREGQQVTAGQGLGQMGGAGRQGDDQYGHHIDMRVYVNDPTRGRVDVSPNLLLANPTPAREPTPATQAGGTLPPPNSATSPGTGSQYTVREGDTLSGIAARNGISLDRLIAANPQIGDPNLIHPGDRVHLPSGAGSRYTVRAGDTLSAIAARSGVQLDRLVAANPQIANPNLIHPGDVINIPTGGSAPAPRPTPAPRLAPADPTPAPRPADGNLIYSNQVSPEFATRVREVAGRLGIDPNYLMAVMHFETGGTFSPSIRNGAGSGATGLIQFLPSTARGLGTTTAELAQMSAVDQLDYVEAYLRPYANRMTNVEDAYMAVFQPAAIGQPSDHVLFSRGSLAYSQNAGLDINGDGHITKGEAASIVRQRYEAGLGR
ncbi:MAG TPA: LysM peptidoglycan-binding domain-containing protein [Thermoanaerobaculia bacterium]|nr:LysM peptidoglycan-binding domain-containing protein [Thermoanaerobaculia bacterium]